MNVDWKYISFEDCLERVPKTEKIKSSEYQQSGAYPIISQEESLISGFWDDYEHIFHIEHPIIIFGDHTRVLKYVDFDFVVGADGVKILSPKPFLLSKFLYYYLKWVNIPSLGYSRHYKLLKELSIPVPSLADQERIVSELDLLSEIINKQKAQLKELDNLAQSIFYDMFGDPVENEKGWEIVLFKDIATFKNGLNYHPIKDGNAIKCIGVGDFQEKKELRCFDQIKEFTISETVEDSYYLQDGDIIIVRSNGNKEHVGRNMVIYPGCQKITYSGFCIRCRISASTIMPIVLNRILSNRSTMMVLRQEGRGCNISNINQRILSSLPIIIPPIELQKEYANKVEMLEKQKELINLSIKETETLFNSRMHYYFN